MFRWWRQTLALIQYTINGLIGDPLVLVFMVVCALGILFFATLPTFASGEELRLIRDQSMAWIWLGGVCLTLFAVERAIAKELRDGGLALTLNRGVPYGTLLIGKWLGIALNLLIFHYNMFFCLLWSTRLGAIGGESQLIDWPTVLWYLGGIVSALLLAGIFHFLWGGNYARMASLLLTVTMTVAFILSLVITSRSSVSFQDVTAIDWKSAWASIGLLGGHLAYSTFLLPLGVLLCHGGVFWMSGILLFIVGLFSKFILTLVLNDGRLVTAIGGFLPEWQIFWLADLLAEDHMFSFRIGLYYGIHLVVQLIGLLTINVLLAIWFLRKKELAGYV